MHGRLGRPYGPFALSAGDLPWEQPLRLIEDGGRGYRDAKRDEGSSGDDELGSYSFGVSMTLRVRATDRAVVCASAVRDENGTSWEGHSSSYRELESLVVDYGEGSPACPHALP
jgi:hypothetical protein